MIGPIDSIHDQNTPGTANMLRTVGCARLSGIART
jgi:hypothetical protein